MGEEYDCCITGYNLSSNKMCDSKYLDYKTGSCDNIMYNYCSDTNKLNEKNCVSWCNDRSELCNSIIEKFCSDENNFSNSNICKNYCLVGNEKNKEFCKLKSTNYCSKDNNFLSKKCKDFCSVKENKDVCNIFVYDGCNKINNEDSYCNCYKKLTSFDQYSNLDKKFDGLTPCIAAECKIGNAYMPAYAEENCPQCLNLMIVGGVDYNAQNLVQSCSINDIDEYNSDKEINDKKNTDNNNNDTNNNDKKITEITEINKSSLLDLLKQNILMISIILCIFVVCFVIFIYSVSNSNYDYDYYYDDVITN